MMVAKLAFKPVRQGYPAISAVDIVSESTQMARSSLGYQRYVKLLIAELE